MNARLIRLKVLTTRYMYSLLPLQVPSGPLAGWGVTDGGGFVLLLHGS